jgi:hypothetical protein
MTVFEATHSETTSKSTAVDAVSYNQNRQELVIDWHDDLYKYTGVPLSVYEALVAGTYKNSLGHESVGRSASKFKRDFGPGTYLGRFGDVTFKDVSQSVKVAPAKVSATPSAAAQTFSLTPSTNVGSEGPSFTVDFRDANGVAREHDVDNVSTWEDAKAEVERLAKAMGVTVTVTGVYVSLV